jgi:hypothetical protein
VKLLLFYYYSTGTTAWYLEKALRKQHEVKTCGPQIKKSSHHDIVLDGGYARLDNIFKTLSKRWRPDLFMMVDSGYPLYPQGISSLPIPTVFYAIDTHVSLYPYKVMAELFDIVFVAQKESVADIRAAVRKRVSWLPLACDPQIHKHYDLPKKYDICFLGGMYPERMKLLEKLSRRFNLYKGYVSLEEMSKIYSQSKIVFNKSVCNDINMRVFEALASVSMLLTDRLHNNGLEELFTDRKDLVLYDEDNLEELVEYYLRRESERELIAASGYKKVLSLHTYEHRVQQILQDVKDLDDFIYRRPNKLLEGIALGKIRFSQSRLGKCLR